VMDRLRALLEQRRNANAADARADAQIAVLHRRADILRGSITAAATCVLLASALVLVLFTMAVFGGRLEMLVIGLFAFSILSLIVSLVLFILDLNQSLRAIEEELRR
jgi:predicted branched-subunit amino acid permease